MEVLLQGCPGHCPARHIGSGLIAELGWPSSPCPVPTVRAGRNNGSPCSAHDSQQGAHWTCPQPCNHAARREMGWHRAEDARIWMGLEIPACWLEWLIGYSPQRRSHCLLLGHRKLLIWQDYLLTQQLSMKYLLCIYWWMQLLCSLLSWSLQSASLLLSSLLKLITNKDAEKGKGLLKKTN